MKKALSWFLVLLMLTAMASLAIAEEPVTLVIWVTEDPDNLAEGQTIEDLFYHQAIKKYEAANPNVKFDIVSLPVSTDESNQKLMLSAAADQLPDLLSAVYSMVASFDPSVMTDITPYLEADPDWKDNYKTGGLETFYDVFGGKTYGVPIKIEGQGFYYNRAMLDSLNLEVPEKMTWDQWIEILEAVKAAGYMPLAQGANASNWSCWGYYPMFANLGLLDELDSLKDGSLKFVDSASFRAVYEHVTELAERGLYPENITTLTYDMAMEKFKAGEAGFISTGSWTAMDMSTLENAEDFGWTWGPIFKNGNEYGVKSFVWGLWAGRSASDSEEKLAAVLDFMKFLSLPESGAMHLEITGELSAAKAEFAPDADVPVVLAMLNDALNDDYAACSQTVDYFDASVYSTFWDAITGCMTGYVTVDEGLEMMDEWYEINYAE